MTEEADEPGGTEAASGDEHPKIDISKALGEAGHEVEELGYEGIPDSAPVVHEDQDVKHALDEMERDIGTRGAG
jgi:hypothetical protein